MPSSINSADASASSDHVAGLHPATFVFGAIAAVVVLSILFADRRPSHQASAMLLGGIAIVGAFLDAPTIYRAQLMRSRWLLLLTFLVFSIATPGVTLGWSRQMTLDGVQLGLMHAVYLCAVLAVIVLLSARLKSGQLADGIACLLGWFLRTPEYGRRIAIRLSLVLEGAASPATKCTCADMLQLQSQRTLGNVDRVVIVCVAAAVALAAMS